MDTLDTNYTSHCLAIDEDTRRLMRGAKVMMVDDEPINMRVLQLHLITEGYERFVTVSDSRTAMQVLRDEKPDVLLLDLNMPEVSGLDILEQIRVDDELRRLPVIVLTSSNNEDIKVRALQLGANDFLAKPVHASELALRMRNTLLARAYEQKIMHMDSLTNLPNRLYLSECIEQCLSTNGNDTGVHALLLINLQSFKVINNSFGASRGDDLLWAFSQRLRSSFLLSEPDPGKAASSEGDDSLLIVRVGGDRFAVLFHMADKPEVQKLMQEAVARLTEALEEPFVVDSNDVFLTLRMGAAWLDERVGTVEALINHAETAMRHCMNNAGADCMFYSKGMIEGTRRLLDIENGLRKAISENNLYLTLQPKVDTHSGLITGAESLLRWNHPELGEVSPVEFIPVAEATSMIVAIGQWVLEQSCTVAAALRRNLAPDFRIAVNVSMVQLNDSKFIHSVERVLESSGLPGSALTLELTENMIMENVDQSIVKLASLRELGIALSIDDFGTGYSSLSYLQSLPIDQLKIDRSFIMQIESESVGSPIVKTIVMLANDLGLSVVAEGVETAEQLAHIQSLSRMEYQGYYKSPPVTVADFVKLLSRNLKQAA